MGLTQPIPPGPQCRARGGLQGTEVDQQQESQDSKECVPARIPGGDMKDSCDAIERPCDLDRPVVRGPGAWAVTATQAESVMAGGRRRPREHVSGLEDLLSGR